MNLHPLTLHAHVPAPPSAPCAELPTITGVTQVGTAPSAPQDTTVSGTGSLQDPYVLNTAPGAPGTGTAVLAGTKLSTADATNHLVTVTVSASTGGGSVTGCTAAFTVSTALSVSCTGVSAMTAGATYTFTITVGGSVPTYAAVPIYLAVPVKHGAAQLRGGLLVHVVLHMRCDAPLSIMA